MRSTLLLAVFASPLLALTLAPVRTPPAPSQNTRPRTAAQDPSAVAAAERSPLVQSARASVAREAAAIGRRDLHDATIDAATNPDTCVAHRRGLDDAAKRDVVRRLIGERLIAGMSEADALAGVFPPIRDDGTPCPKLPQRFGVAPGGNGGHHDYPGGLAVHTAYNLAGALNLIKENADLYGVHADADVVRAAVIWHDWAKTIVHQWRPDGTLTAEITIGQTGGHHVLGLAEAIARRLPPDEVLAQAAAHAAPGLGADDTIARWILAAAIIARQDPVKLGYLARGANGAVHLPSIRPALGRSGPSAAPTSDPFTAPLEAAIVNVADANYYSIAATAQVEALWPILAPEFGYTPSDVASFRNDFRNPVLSYDSADRLAVAFRTGGLDAVRKELRRLETLGVFAARPHR